MLNMFCKKKKYTHAESSTQAASSSLAAILRDNGDLIDRIANGIMLSSMCGNFSVTFDLNKCPDINKALHEGSRVREYLLRMGYGVESMPSMEGQYTVTW